MSDWFDCYKHCGSGSGISGMSSNQIDFLRGFNCEDDFVSAFTELVGESYLINTPKITVLDACIKLMAASD